MTWPLAHGPTIWLKMSKTKCVSALFRVEIFVTATRTEFCLRPPDLFSGHYSWRVRIWSTKRYASLSLLLVGLLGSQAFVHMFLFSFESSSLIYDYMIVWLMMFFLFCPGCDVMFFFCYRRKNSIILSSINFVRLICFRLGLGTCVDIICMTISK